MKQLWPESWICRWQLKLNLESREKISRRIFGPKNLETCSLVELNFSETFLKLNQLIEPMIVIYIVQHYCIQCSWCMLHCVYMHVCWYVHGWECVCSWVCCGTRMILLHQLCSQMKRAAGQLTFWWQPSPIRCAHFDLFTLSSVSTGAWQRWHLRRQPFQTCSGCHHQTKLFISLL